MNSWGVIIPSFTAGLSVGLGVWYWSSQQWQKSLQKVLSLYPPERDTPKITPRLRLLRIVKAQQEKEYLLQQRLQMYQTILKQAPFGYIEVDQLGYLDWFNCKATELLDIQRRPPPDDPQRLLLQVVRSYELDRLILKTRQSQELQQLNWTFHAPSPHNPSLTKDFPMRGVAFPSGAGSVGVFLEDRSEAEQLLAERDRWTSDVAHELKTPLTSIRLIAETLQTKSDAYSKPWLDRLIQETMRLSVLVQDILELSYISFPHSNAFKFDTLDLAKLIQQAWVTLEPLAQAKNLFLFYDGPEMYLIRGDSGRLLRVMMNVVENSIKFSPANAPICIRILPQVDSPFGEGEQAISNWMAIEVYDTGVGFPEESLNRVFERFYKADPSRERQSTSPVALEDRVTVSETPMTGGGSGLGLAIVKQIIAAHDGKVVAQNHPETGGAWMRIFLPNRSS